MIDVLVWCYIFGGVVCLVLVLILLNGMFKGFVDLVFEY